MIVAYDARYASDHFAGIGRHAHALLEALLAAPGDERYVVLWNPTQRNTRHDLAPLRSHPRVRWVERAYPLVHPWGAVQVGAWLRSERPDVYLSPFSLRPLGAPCPEVLTLHDVSALRGAHIPSRVAQWVYEASLALAKGAAALITDSEFSRGEIVELLRVNPARVHAIHLGVPPRAPAGEPPRRPEALRAERFALVVGDNRPRKNLGLLAEAWREGAPGIGLVAVGHVDPRFPSLRELARGNAAVEVMGWLSPGELEWLYAHAELLVLPSTYEGFGLPLLEAMAASLPAVVADIPVFREVGGGAAVYVDPHAARAWAVAVRELAGDAPRRAALGAAGRAHAAGFTYAATAAATLAVLRSVARGGRA